jgi:hypothetical protein
MILLRWSLIACLALFSDLLVVVPTEAAASLTFDLTPAQPAPGQEAVLVVHTWATGAGGGADQSMPLDMTAYPFSVRAYPSQELVKTGPTEFGGFGIQLQEVAQYRWNAHLSFPSAGPWVIVFRNFYPPLTQATPPPGTATLAVEVQATLMPPPGTGTRAGLLLPALIAAAGVVAACAGFGAAFGVRHKRRLQGR